MSDTDSQSNMNSDSSKSGSIERTIIVWSVVTAVLVVGLVLVVWKYALAPLQTGAPSPTQTSSSADLQEIRRVEDSILSSYQLIPSNAGTYRVPIQRAMELIASEWTAAAR
jgi:hypothetical protein